MIADEQKVRLDKWLWAARFFKTRSMAAKAVAGGKVHLNGSRVKPSRAVDVGVLLRIQKEPYAFEVVVQALSGRRGPATVARTLYEETEKSLLQREHTREERRLLANNAPAPSGRPTKRDRRLIKKFIRNEE